jgi:hemoglobin
MSSWDELGGDEVMGELLADFYRRIDASPIRRLFPPDLDETLRKQVAFQGMFWGGPDRYTPWRGHPRLRARHLPFPIGVAEAEAWFACMEAAVAASRMPEAARAPFLAQMRKTAYAMINQAPKGGG